MQKRKTMLAVALAATMVLGTSTAVFAADPVTSGSATGAGSSEGHVSKHLINVVLPTATDATFAYKIDPERLVTETNAGKYAEGSTFTPESKTNGVYFQTGEKAYDTKSTALTVTSKSSAAVNLTVEVKAVPSVAATDIPLLAAVPSLETVSENAGLYMALTMGSEEGDTKAVKLNETVSITKALAGVPANFETVVDQGEYAYKEKSDASGWSTATIQMTGVCTKSDAEGLTAPTLQVTWKYEDPAATPETPVITEPQASATSIALGGSVDITLPEGVTITEIQKKKTDGSFNALPDTFYTLSDITNGKKLDLAANMRETYASASQIKVVFSEGDPITLDVTE